MAVRPKTYDRPGYRSREIQRRAMDRMMAKDVAEALSDEERREIDEFKPISQDAIDREADRLHNLGKRNMVVALLGKYGLFTDRAAVDEYLAGGELA